MFAILPDECDMGGGRTYGLMAQKNRRVDWNLLIKLAIGVVGLLASGKPTELVRTIKTPKIVAMNTFSENFTTNDSVAVVVHRANHK